MYRQKAHGMSRWAALLPALLLTGCGSVPVYNETFVQTAPPAIETALPEATAAETTMPIPTDTVMTETETTTAESAAALLSAPEEIALQNTDGEGYAYVFWYGGEEFQAYYTADHWKVVDSYRIRNPQDMVTICQALRDEHPIHSADYQSYRTAEDMAYEWAQHNLAYDLLPDDSAWKSHVRDVDIDPADQGKSVYDLYKDRSK